MTDYQKYINALRKCAKEHANDTTYTGHIRVSDLCRDTANLLEELEQEPILDKIRAEIENMQIVYDKSANYKDERTDEEKANDLGKMYKVLVLSIIDKYRAERKEKHI
jgi:hypothetical protein